MSYHGMDGSLRRVHREAGVEQISLQMEIREKKVGEPLKGIRSFSLVTSATETISFLS